MATGAWMWADTGILGQDLARRIPLNWSHAGRPAGIKEVIAELMEQPAERLGQPVEVRLWDAKGREVEQSFCNVAAAIACLQDLPQRAHAAASPVAMAAAISACAAAEEDFRLRQRDLAVYFRLLAVEDRFEVIRVSTRAGIQAISKADVAIGVLEDFRQALVQASKGSLEGLLSQSNQGALALRSALETLRAGESELQAGSATFLHTLAEAGACLRRLRAETVGAAVETLEHVPSALHHLRRTPASVAGGCFVACAMSTIRKESGRLQSLGLEAIGISAELSVLAVEMHNAAEDIERIVSALSAATAPSVVEAVQQFLGESASGFEGLLHADASFTVAPLNQCATALTCFATALGSVPAVQSSVESLASAAACALQRLTDFSASARLTVAGGIGCTFLCKAQRPSLGWLAGSKNLLKQLALVERLVQALPCTLEAVAKNLSSLDASELRFVGTACDAAAKKLTEQFEQARQAVEAVTRVRSALGKLGNESAEIVDECRFVIHDAGQLLSKLAESAEEVPLAITSTLDGFVGAPREVLRIAEMMWNTSLTKVDCSVLERKADVCSLNASLQGVEQMLPSFGQVLERARGSAMRLTHFCTSVPDRLEAALASGSSALSVQLKPTLQEPLTALLRLKFDLFVKVFATVADDARNLQGVSVVIGEPINEHAACIMSHVINICAHVEEH